MADMDNKQFKDKLAELGDKPGKDDVLSVLKNIGSLEGYDKESLDKLVGLMESMGTGMPGELADSLSSKIIEQRKKLEEQPAKDEGKEEQPTQEQPAKDEGKEEQPTQEQPAKDEGKEEQPTQEQPAKDEGKEEQPAKGEGKEEQPTKGENKQELTFEQLDKRTSHDILHLYTDADRIYNGLQAQFAEIQDPSTPGVKELEQKIQNLAKLKKTIEDYATQELQETELSFENPDNGEKQLLPLSAPTVKDYVDILTTANKDYKYENQTVLDAALAEYDRIYGLTNESASQERAREIQQNADAWQSIAPADYESSEITQEDSLKLLKKEDEKTYKELLETLRAVAITELAVEEPGSKKAEKYYKEKYDEVATRYLAQALSTLNQIKQDPQQQEMWWKEYCKANRLPPENLSAISADKAHQEAYNKFVISNVYKALNCTYTQANAVYASRLAQKTGMRETLPIASQHKVKIWEKHPQLMKMAKVSAIKIGASVGFGIVGATVAQLWQTTTAFKEEINKCKEQNGGKVSVKSFAKYLKKNPESAIKLAQNTMMTATVGIAATAIFFSGGAALGAAGMLGGAAVTNVVGAAAIRGAKTVVGATISAAAGIATYMVTKKLLKPKKTELMAILEQCLPADQQQAENKGLLSRFKKQKTPAQEAYDDLTKLWKNGDKKLSEKIDTLDLPKEQKDRVMQLAKEIKGLKTKAAATIGGTVLGATATAFFMDSGHSAGASSGGKGTFDLDKGIGQNLEDNAFKPQGLANDQEIKTPYAPGMQPEESAELAGAGELHAFALTDSRITDKPNATFDILKSMGLMDKKFSMVKGVGASTHNMEEYLSKLQLTEAQQQEFQAKLDSGEFDKIAYEYDHNIRTVDMNGKITIHDHSVSNSNSISHTHTNTGSVNTDAVDASKAIKEDAHQIDLTQIQGMRVVEDPSQTQMMAQPQKMEIVNGKTESGNWLKRIFSKKHEGSIAVPEGTPIEQKAEIYAGQRAMAEYNAKHPDQQITSAQEMMQHGYNVKGTVDGHKVHVKVSNDGNTVTRTVDDVRMKMHKIGDQSNSEVVTFKHNYVDANTVGNAGGVEQDTKLGIIKNNNERVTYYQDGDTKKVYEEHVTSNGQKTVTESKYSAGKVKSILRNFGATYGKGERDS